jgi:hypothetical protein
LEFDYGLGLIDFESVATLALYVDFKEACFIAEK